jgi:hypothetical protein
VVRSFGASGAALKIARELDLAGTIDRALGGARGDPSAGEMICLAAINRAVCPRSKRQLADWHSRTMLARAMPYPARSLSSQRFWDAMDLVSDEVIRAAESEIVARAIERYEIRLEPLVFDTTNFATFVDSGNQRNTIARRGHAKGGRRDLRLIGLALRRAGLQPAAVPPAIRRQPQRRDRVPARARADQRATDRARALSRRARAADVDLRQGQQLQGQPDAGG